MHAGVKSTALLFGSATKPWLAAFGASSIGLLGLAGGDPLATGFFASIESLHACESIRLAAAHAADNALSRHNARHAHVLQCL